VGLFTVSLEKELYKKLARYCKTYNATLLENKTFTYKEKNYTIPYLIVSSYGTIIVKTLCHSGEVFGTENEDNWLHICDKPPVRATFKNPISDMSDTIQSYKHFVIENGVKQGKVSSFFVIQNKTVCNIPKKLNVLNINDFFKKIKTEEFLLDNKYDSDKIKSILN